MTLIDWNYADVEEIVKQATHRWFNTAEVYKIFENREKLDILAKKPQQMPTSIVSFGISFY